MNQECFAPCLSARVLHMMQSPLRCEQYRAHTAHIMANIFRSMGRQSTNTWPSPWDVKSCCHGIHPCDGLVRMGPGARASQHHTMTRPWGLSHHITHTHEIRAITHVGVSGGSQVGIYRLYTQRFVHTAGSIRARAGWQRRDLHITRSLTICRSHVIGL